MSPSVRVDVMTYEHRMIQALGASWHAHHFMCGGCRKDMGGGSFMERAGRPTARRATPTSSRRAARAAALLSLRSTPSGITCTKCRKPVTDSTFSVLDNKPPCGKCA